MALKALAFLLALGIVVAGAEALARKVPNSYEQKKAGLRQAGPSTEILILGASEAFQGIAPGGLKAPAYDLANVGQSLYYDRALFEQALPRLPQLRWLVLGLSYPSFYYRLDRSPEAWRAFAYQLSFGIPSQDPQQRWDIRNRSALYFYEPLKVLQWALTGKGIETPRLDQSGFEALPSLDEEQADLLINELTARKKARYHRSIMDEALEAENVAQVEGMLALARARGVRVALIFPPVTHAYEQALEPSLRAKGLACAKKIAAQDQAIYRDYSGDARFRDADFYDIDHLSGTGAMKFSALLDSEVLRLKR